MPVHNWKRVDAGLFHDFHQSWTVALRNALNAGVLPADHFALVEQNVRGPIADVLTLRLARDDDAAESDLRRRGSRDGAAAHAARPPQRSQPLRRAGQSHQRPPSARRCRGRHRDRLAGEQGAASRAPRVHPEVGGAVAPGSSLADHRPVPAHAARPARHPQGDLGRVRWTNRSSCRRTSR